MSCGCGCNDGSCGQLAGGLGDLFCTSVDCNNAVQEISLMDSIYQGLDPSFQGNFQSSHDAIMAQYNSIYSFYSCWIPATGTCSQLQTLGSQAAALTTQMQQASGQTPLTQPAASGASLSTLAIGAAIALGAVLWLKK